MSTIKFLIFSGQFLLTNLLLETMKKTAGKSLTEGRIINVSSFMHIYGVHKEGIRFEEINNEKRYVHFAFSSSFFSCLSIHDGATITMGPVILGNTLGTCWLIRLVSQFVLLFLWCLVLIV